MFRIRLLGGASIEGPSGSLTGRVTQRAPLALIAVLAAGGARGMSREKLAALLWPESDEARARHLVRDTVYRIREALGETAVRNSGAELWLDRDKLHCDLWELDRALSSGDDEHVVALYGGPFLDGFHLEDAPEFERWVDGMRGTIARRYVLALEAFAEKRSQVGDQQIALALWNRRVDADPYGASGAVGLMRALDAAGDRPAAIRHGLKHAALLRDELGAEPDQLVADFVDQLRRSGARAEVSSERPSVVIGRGELKSVPERARRETAIRGMVGAVAVAALIAAAVFWPRRDVHLAAARERVLVDICQNKTGQPALAHVGAMASDWVTQAIAQTRLVRVVPVLSVLGRSSGEADTDVRALARATHTMTIVSCAYYVSGDSLVFQSRLTSVADGTVLRAIPTAAVPLSAPIAGIDRLRHEVVAALAPLVDPRMAEHAREATQPPSYEAYREYAAALELMANGNDHQSLPHFRAAASLDSSYTLPVLMMAVAAMNAREFATADSLTRRVALARETLPPLEQAMLDNVQAALRGDDEACYAASRRAAEEGGSSLARAQVAYDAARINRPREALRILRALDPAHGELRGVLYYWTQLVALDHWLGNHEDELRDIARARVFVHDRATVQRWELRALGALGRVDEIRERLDEMVAGESKDNVAIGNSMFQVAMELRAHGHGVAATEFLKRSIQWYDSRTATSSSSRDVKLRFAAALVADARFADAKHVVQTMGEEEPSDVRRVGLEGVIGVRRGDTATVERSLARLAAARAEPYAWGEPTYWRSAIEAALGRREAAVSLLRAAFAEGKDHELWLHVDPNLEPLRDYEPLRNLLRPKG